MGLSSVLGTGTGTVTAIVFSLVYCHSLVSQAWFSSSRVHSRLVSDFTGARFRLVFFMFSFCLGLALFSLV